MPEFVNIWSRLKIASVEHLDLGDSAGYKMYWSIVVLDMDVNACC